MKESLEIKGLHVHTPLLESYSMSKIIGCSVFLKMEALQPVGSFKIRGIGLLCQKLISEGAKHVIASSGGNAGLAVAYAARKLGVKATVVVPKTTSKIMLEKIKAEDGKIMVYGESWDEADKRARELCASSSCAYVPPFDHPVIWEGHASLIHEVSECSTPFDLIILAVGGGGLLCGVLRGLHQVGWYHIPVLAIETEGAASFDAACRENRLVTLSEIKTIATSLGAKTVSQEALTWNHRHRIYRQVVSDRDAIQACLRFADDHRILVEPACGAALSAVYRKKVPLKKIKSILIIVCGGAGVDLSELERWNSVFSGKTKRRSLCQNISTAS